MGIAGQDTHLLVIDPVCRKLYIPRTALRETKALSRDAIPSVCMLFLSGRCRQGAGCNQVHADPGVVAELRNQATSRPDCCQMHGDVTMVSSTRTFVVDSVPIPLNRIAATEGLKRSLEADPMLNGTVPIPPTFVCRLHAGGHCRYREECKFVHICREVCAQQLSHCVLPLVHNVEKKSKVNATNSKSSAPLVAVHPSTDCALTEETASSGSGPTQASVNSTESLGVSLMMPAIQSAPTIPYSTPMYQPAMTAAPNTTQLVMAPPPGNATMMAPGTSSAFQPPQYPPQLQQQGYIVPAIPAVPSPAVVQQAPVPLPMMKPTMPTQMAPVATAPPMYPSAVAPTLSPSPQSGHFVIMMAQ